MIADAFKAAPKAPGNNRRDCVVCGGPKVVRISVAAMCVQRGWVRNESGYTSQRSVTLCEEHALALWEDLTNRIAMVRTTVRT